MREPKLLSNSKSRKVGALVHILAFRSFDLAARCRCCLWGPGISNLGTHGSARCLYSPSLDTRLVPHEYNENKVCVHAWKRLNQLFGCEDAKASRSIRTIHTHVGLFPQRVQYRTIGIFWSIFHVARLECSPRVSTRRGASKSSLAAKD